MSRSSTDTTKTGRVPEIILPKSEVERCIRFAKSASHTQIAKEFGETDNEARSNSEIQYDVFVGKLGEAAVSSYFQNANINIEDTVDYGVYELGVGDHGDLKMGKGWIVDVKTTKRGQFLMFEPKRLMVYYDAPNMSPPDMIILCQVPGIKANRPFEPRPVVVRLLCAISLKRLISGNDPRVLRLLKGQNIPGTQVPLQADNYVVSARDLKTQWDVVVEYVKTHSPPKYRLYHCFDPRARAG